MACSSLFSLLQVALCNEDAKEGNLFEGPPEVETRYVPTLVYFVSHVSAPLFLRFDDLIGQHAAWFALMAKMKD